MTVFSLLLPSLFCLFQLIHFLPFFNRGMPFVNIFSHFLTHLCQLSVSPPNKKLPSVDESQMLWECRTEDEALQVAALNCTSILVSYWGFFPLLHKRWDQQQGRERCCFQGIICHFTYRYNSRFSVYMRILRLSSPLSLPLLLWKSNELYYNDKVHRYTPHFP